MQGFIVGPRRPITLGDFLYPMAVYRGRMGGHPVTDICIGFVWTGFMVISIGKGWR